jgi:hypothetical protein
MRFALFAAALLSVTLSLSQGPCLAATPPDAARVALRNALASDASGCTASELTAIVDGAEFTPLGKIGTSPVVIASPHGSCICGNVNCPYLALRLDPDGKSAVLLSTYAYQVTPVGKAKPLPNLRELAHDSALVSIETTDAFSAGYYAMVDTARVRGDNGARKPSQVPVRFAPGASSAVLSGHVSAGWFDDYLIAAASGQRVTIAAVHGPADLTFALVPRSGNGDVIRLKADIPAVLPASGDYLLHIDTGSAGDVAYRATLSIR